MQVRPSMCASRVGAVLLCLACVTAIPVARAADTQSFYAGAAAGLSTASYQGFGSSSWKLSGWKAMAGWRPERAFALEAEYLNFGHSTVPYYAAFGQGPLQGQSSALALDAVGFLPAVSPTLDLFGKLGVARVHDSSSVPYADPMRCIGESLPGCAGFGYATQSTDQTGFDVGVGGQWQLDSWALRLEYQFFDTSGFRVQLISAGAVLRF